VSPPISYYGGKQRMAQHIIPLIPKHTVYVEPFTGGGAVLFKKPYPRIRSNHDYREVINDIDGHLINFYKQLRDNGEELIRRLELTPFSREEHKESKNLDDPDPIERARKYFVNIMQGFSNILNASWTVGIYGRNLQQTFSNKVDNLKLYLKRMRSIAIENRDAIEIIKQYDSPQTFFYCDPPYINAN
jgi:DNA adenine methylase